MCPAAAAAVTLLLVLVHVQEAAADDVTGRVRHNCQTRYPAHACGDGWFRIDMYRCAKYFRTPRTFRDADNNCRRLRGHLVSMHNSVEYSQVLCLAFRANTHKDHFWIGGRSKYLWHSFQWTDNTPFHFARWGFMQPDMVSGEECVEMNYKHKYTWTEWGLWNNAVCSGRKYYVCARRS